jgi:hypothetical protein
MFEAGAEAVNQSWVRLLLKLKPHLSPEALEILENEIRDMAAAGEKVGGVWWRLNVEPLSVAEPCKMQLR